jgi:CheY-like chemotaxis protein
MNEHRNGADEQAARYRATLSEKLSELALAWEEWLAAPAEESGKKHFHALVHRLAGAASAYGFDDVGREAQHVDSLITAWDADVPSLRTPMAEFCRELATAAETLLRVLGRAARDAARGAAGNGAGQRDDRVIYVLFLEDDRDQAQGWRDALSREGLRVRIVESPQALEAELVMERPDVMLIDFWHDGANAAEVARGLRDKPEFAHIPKVCLVEDVGSLPRQTAMDAGFAAVLRNSVAAGDLAQVLRQAVANVRTR